MDLLGLYPRDEFRKKMTERNDPLAMRIKAQIDTEVSLLRGTIGNAQWLDSLDDEQWRVLVHEIMPLFYREEWQRGETDKRLDKKLKLLAALEHAVEVAETPGVLQADIEHALSDVLKHYKDDTSLREVVCIP